jgi:hypothetical protein
MNHLDPAKSNFIRPREDAAGHLINFLDLGHGPALHMVGGKIKKKSP